MRFLKKILLRHNDSNLDYVPQRFRDKLKSPSLWYFNRKSVPKSFAIGLFCAFLPIPFQSIIVIVAAIFFTANLPLALALVWVSNPVTIPFLFFICYKTGSVILHSPFDASKQVTLGNLWQVIGEIWQPFLLGCFVMGTVCATIGYYGMKLFFIWRIYRRSLRDHH